MQQLTLRLLMILSLITAALLLGGCAHVIEELTRDPRDAPWDPRAGQGQLFDQIPAWDNAAERICCSGLLGDRAAWEAARCDTAEPVPPRSNRC